MAIRAAAIGRPSASRTFHVRAAAPVAITSRPIPALAKFVAELLVMPLQTQAIGFIQRVPLKQLEQRSGVFGLGIHRIQRAADYLGRRVRIIGHALPIKRLVLPSVVDAGQNPVALIPGDHLNEGATAIAIDIFAVKLDEGVLASREAGCGRSIRRVPQMDAANFKARNFREHGVKGDHGGSACAGRHPRQGHDSSIMT